MNKSSFFIVGKHAVFEALKNEKRKILKVFLTEESKKKYSQIKSKKKFIKGCQNIFQNQERIRQIF